MKQRICIPQNGKKYYYDQHICHRCHRNAANNRHYRKLSLIKLERLAISMADRLAIVKIEIDRKIRIAQEAK